MSELPPHPGPPRWVRILGLIAFLLLLVIVVLHLTGRGLRGHGPPSHHTSLSIVPPGERGFARC